MNGALYIVGAGMTEDFAAVRHPTTLAIHRITDLTLTERRFDFDPPEAEPDAFGLPWHEPRSFRVRFKPGKATDYVRERIWADEQKMEDLEDGGLLLEVTTRSEPEFMAWVRSFGEDASMSR
jgi:predicted DNA-binding transcriptional regulator YafY